MDRTPSDTSLIRAGDLAIRPLRDDARDMALMAGWLADPRVLEWYEGRDRPFTLDTVRRTYGPRVLSQAGVVPCLIEWREQPVGYIQFYRHTVSDLAELAPGAPWPAYGIDLFLGVPALWGRGVGTRALQALCRWLFFTRGARLITIDPRTTNTRALRSYAKAGFRPGRVLPAHEWHEGAMHDVLLMTLERMPDAEQRQS